MDANQAIDKVLAAADAKKVRKIAVENFLGSLDGLSKREAEGNLVLDARSYNWNVETRRAIALGINLIYR